MIRLGARVLTSAGSGSGHMVPFGLLGLQGHQRSRGVGQRKHVSARLLCRARAATDGPAGLIDVTHGTAGGGLVYNMRKKGRLYNMRRGRVHTMRRDGSKQESSR
jgi:hypothetical protein